MVINYAYIRNSLSKSLRYQKKRKLGIINYDKNSSEAVK